MKTNWNLLKAGALLFALPLMATAAVSASQWVNDTAPIDLNIEVAEIETSIGVARAHAVSLNSSGAIEGRVAAMNTDGTQGIADLTGLLPEQRKSCSRNCHIFRRIIPC